MSKASLGKYKKARTSLKFFKKGRKEFLQETISLLSLPANSDVLTHIPREVQQEVILVFLQLRTATYKEEPGVSGSTFE